MDHAKTRRLPRMIAAAALAASAPVAAASLGQRSQPPKTVVSTDVACRAEVGVGVKTHRHFCDVTIGAAGDAAVRIAIPKHTGPTSLMFDLHNRFVAAADADPEAHLPQTALVAVVGPDGKEIHRAAVSGQLRTHDDVFDDIQGAAANAVRAVAPGAPEQIRVTLPAAVSAVAIVGLNLSVMNADGPHLLSTPARPVALVSNVRVVYQPAK
jgi:hypothetical protein